MFLVYFAFLCAMKLVAPVINYYYYYYYYYYLLRSKAAQHNTTITKKTVEKHKKLQTKIHNNKANHTANEIVVHGSVHNSFLK